MMRLRPENWGNLEDSWAVELVRFLLKVAGWVIRM